MDRQIIVKSIILKYHKKVYFYDSKKNIYHVFYVAFIHCYYSTTGLIKHKNISNQVFKLIV